MPRYAKAVAIAVAAYALSPIDLIPDFVPVVGYLDDAVIVPAGILLAVKLVPPLLMAEFRAAAVSSEGERMLGRRAAAVVIVLWASGAAVGAAWLGGADAAHHDSVSLRPRGVKRNVTRTPTRFSPTAGASVTPRPASAER